MIQKYELIREINDIHGEQCNRHGHDAQRQRSMWDPMYKYSKWTIEWEWFSDEHKKRQHNIDTVLDYFKRHCQSLLDESKVNARMCDYMWGQIVFLAFTNDFCDRIGKNPTFGCEFCQYLIDESEKLYFRAKTETNGKWYADPSTAWQDFFDRTVPILVKKANLKFEGTI